MDDEQLTNLGLRVVPGRSQLSVLPLPGSVDSTFTPAGNFAAELFQLSWTGRKLVPHCGAYP